MSIKKMISYREVWMGFAILWIMLFHSGMDLIKGFSGIKGIGYGGVDIFLFSSGIGNYYSYLRDEKPLDFIKRRIHRLAPVYVPFIIIWCVYFMLQGELDPLYISGNILGIQGFSSSGKSFNWFLTVLVICYLLTPYLATFIRNNSLRKDIILILGLFLLSMSFIGDNRLIVSITRIPVYAEGMIFAKYDNIDIKKHLGILFAMFVTGFITLFVSLKYAVEYLWDYGLYWYPFILITPFLCVTISVLSMQFEKAQLKWLLNVFTTIGGISFEIFLIHVFIFDIVSKKTDISNIQWTLICIGAIALSFAYSKLVKAALTRCRSK